MKDEIRGKIRATIYNWVADNFGESEADDPSWSIDALADELVRADLIYDIYQRIEIEYLREDVKYYADEHDYKLTEQQVHNVAEKIRNSDWYCNINADDMEYYINRELTIAKEK